MKKEIKKQKAPADRPSKCPSKPRRTPSPHKRKYLAIGFQIEADCACSANVEINPSTVGFTPGTGCEAAQAAADQLMVLRPCMAANLDRLWLVDEDLQVVGDWRQGEHYECDDLDGVEIDEGEPLGLRCQACGEVWQAHIGDDGLLADDFAICKKGCNRQK